MCGFCDLQCLQRPYLVVILNMILEMLMITLQLYLYNPFGSSITIDMLVDEISLGISTLFLILSGLWIFALRRQALLSKHRLIKGIQGTIMIVNGLFLLVYLIQDKVSEQCKLIEISEDRHICEQFEIRVTIAFLAIINGFIYFARRPILPEFIVEIEPEDLYFHRRFLGDNQDYLKELKRNSRGSALFDEEGRALYASFPHLLDDYIVKVDVLPEYQAPAAGSPLKTSRNSSNATTLTEIDNLEELASAMSGSGGGGGQRSSFYLNQEYFLPNLPKRSSKAGGSSSTEEDNRYSTLSRDTKNTVGFT